MDTTHGRTGVFYQAMPAIGADGKNIMKLIPVQMVNRQFFQTQTRKPEMDPSSQKAVTINIASAPVNMATKTVLSSSVSQQITRKQVSVVNVNLGHSNSLNKHSSQQKTLNLMAEVPPVATFTKKSGMPVKHINQLPVTVKSPALPRGQYLQIPPNAQVQTVPASKLPPGIQKQIFTSSASSSSLGSVLPNVVFVSPVTTVNQSVTSPSDAAPSPLQVFPNPSSVTSRGLQPKEAKQQLKLIPKVSQRPNSPTRWVIEEVDASAGPNIKPLNCPSVTSEILRAVAQRENSCKQFKAFRRTVTQLSQDSAVQGQQNALVMCNGKFLQSAATHTRQDIRMPRESDEVIDLCGDDDDESPQQAASINMSAVSHLDEDNVIFVSYIPPKSESCSRNCTTSDRGGAEPSQGLSERNETRVCDPAVMFMNIQQSTSTQQLEGIEDDAKTEGPVAPSSSFQIERNSHIMEGSTNPKPLAPKPCQVSDHLLRQVFGITAELKVCLQRVDDAAVGSVPADPLHIEPIRSVEDNEEPMGDVFVYEPSSSQKNNIDSGDTDFQRVKVLIGKEPSASPHTGITACRCSHAKLNQKSSFALEQKFFSHSRAICDCETKQVTGYVEPIDETFPSKNENTILQSQYVDAHLQAQTWLDLSRKTRMGRTRKRTVCPCCIPTTLDPAVKSRAGEELEKWALTAEQMSKKGGRAKVPRKDGRMSCEEAKNKPNFNTHGAPTSDNVSTSSVDSDELKRQEQIKRLKDVLKEKEAALELMRNRVS
ncbi:ligand-dependent nuclear receptor-interacting factor 1 isoform X2 [Archocentrus centrarchus]|uniref:ligand-dependent nuclear receptor-interacting factor 1 isoform X2 n=1 Tax=Archocentrus centrarchus TaxID=63155 RepID=UPI0011EA4C57|nr:ligand-dependent nuclear receptor-interacting factor 1 isoform X2 [Archocentrus centrarchus]